MAPKARPQKGYLTSLSEVIVGRKPDRITEMLVDTLRTSLLRDYAAPGIGGINLWNKT